MSNVKHKIFVGFVDAVNAPDVPPETFYILLENGSKLLLENGNKILKENG